MNKKYKNRQFKTGSLSLVVAILLLAAIIVSGLFAWDRAKTKEKFNIEKTSVDFIIQTPSAEQVEEIRGLNHINNVTPYYFSAGNAKINGKTVKSELYLVESLEDLPNTLFSDRLLVEEIKDQPSSAIVYIDSSYAKKNGLKAGDNLKLQNASGDIDCVVGKIFKADGRHDNGMLMAVLDGEIKEAIGEAATLRYSGAYIDSKDNAATEEYLKEYIPEGDLRPRSDFDSDELYEAYLDTHNSADSSQTTFYRDHYLKEMDNRYSGQLLRDMILSFIFIVVVLLIGLIAFTAQTSKYIKNEVIKDIRNNFSLEQEKEMLSSYFIGSTVLMIISTVFGSCINILIFKLPVLNVPLIAAIIAVIVMAAIPRGSMMKLLETEYYERAKQVEEERKRAEERKREAGRKNANEGETL